MQGPFEVVHTRSKLQNRIHLRVGTNGQGCDRGAPEDNDCGRTSWWSNQAQVELMSCCRCCARAKAMPEPRVCAVAEMAGRAERNSRTTDQRGRIRIGRTVIPGLLALRHAGVCETQAIPSDRLRSP